MPAQLLDGNALSKKLRAEIAARGAIVTAKGVRPGLAVIVVGENPASQVYVRNKVKACEDVGFHSVLERGRITRSYCHSQCRPIDSWHLGAIAIARTYCG